jgi:hypothetical protein
MSSKPKEATLTDVLSAVQGVSQKVEAVAGKVEALDRRVTSLEQPALKPRSETPIRSSEKRPAPGGGRVTIEDVGGDAEKYFAPMLCRKLAVTKDRKREDWRVDLFLKGLRRPASLIEWQFDTIEELIEFVQVGWPEFSADHFDERRFIELDAEYQQLRDEKALPPKPPRIIYGDGISFMVEAVKTRRDARGQTYINVVAIYPFGG